MYPSTNTCSGTNTSTETKTLALYPSNLSYVTQTDLSNTIKVLLANFYDKHAKQDAKFKENIKTVIANQDAKVEDKFEK